MFRRLAELLFLAARPAAPILVVALLLERWLPISSGQHDLTHGFCHDLIYYMADFVRAHSWISLYMALLIWIRHSILGNFELVPLGALPAWLAWCLAFLIGDLLAYFSHRVRHRVDFFWRFHAVHHSQRELNFFTQHRFHDVDTIVDMTLRVFPLLLIQSSWLALGIFQTVSLAHFHLYHSRIRTNYGVLRYVLITPQSHRVHHARDYRQQNSNFGIFFSFWDHAFGTQYWNYDEYPEELGIEDGSFPLEQRVRLRDFPRVYASQLLYPFLKLRKSASGREKDAASME